MVLENMSRGMQRAFCDVDPSQVAIRLVGGHKKSDFLKQLKGTYYPEEEEMWSFAAVVRRCVSEALPGAPIDSSLLNRCDGVDNASFTWAKRWRLFRQGQVFRVVALDSHTGIVETQTSDDSDCRGSAVPGSSGFVLPKSVLLDVGRHSTEMMGRVERQIPGMKARRELSPIMTEYRD